MKLSLSQIKEMTTGAVRVEEMEDGIHFYRFTKQQEKLYKNRDDGFYVKTFATSGVQLRFFTDSEFMSLQTEVSRGSSRSYFAFDVFVNGKKLDDLNNFSNAELPCDYTAVSFPFGTFSKKFHLGAGEKEVCVYFPWSVSAVMKELTLDDHSFVKPYIPAKKMLCFGDSITHGYDALYPCNKYITNLANLLDAQEFNKAIGGEVFFPELAATKEDFEPDYITVAYGTNNWSHSTREEFTYNCKVFLCNLHKNYPNSKIFVLTPIWRKDMDENRVFGQFACVAEIIKEQAAAFDNISVIYGFDFVPQDERFFADLRLHPNDEGFKHYFENLSKQIKDVLRIK